MEDKNILNTNQIRELYKFNVTRDLAIIFQGLGIIFLFIFLYIFTLIYGLIAKSSISSNFKASNILVLFVLIILTLILHELIHAMAIVKFGGNARFGAGISHYILPYLYATSDKMFLRSQFILIALAPLFVITVIGIVLMFIFKEVAQWFIIPLSMNMSGAIADILTFLILVKYPKHVLIKDDGFGFTIYGGDTDYVVSVPPKGFIVNLIKGFAIGICSLIILTFILPILLDIMNVKSFIIGIAHTPFILLEFTGGKDFGVTIPILPILAVSGLFGLIYTLARTLLINHNYKC